MERRIEEALKIVVHDLLQDFDYELRVTAASSCKAPQEAVRRISHYSSDMDILLVGEGDFSFAAALARAFEIAPRLLATSLDSQEMLHNNYGRRTMKQRLAELSRRNAVVITEVDVKRIKHHPSLHHLTFDRIIYNFPHSGFVSGLTEHDSALIRKHRQLMRSFFKNVRRMIKDDGEVHVAHHMCQPYSKWRLEEEAAKSGFELRACHKFKTQDFPGYKPRRGTGDYANDTFRLRKPAIFIFFIPRSSPPPCHNIPSPPPKSPLCSISSASPSQIPSMTHSCLSVLCPPHPHPPSPSPSPSPRPPHVPHFPNAISAPTSPHHLSPPPDPTITPPCHNIPSPPPTLSLCSIPSASPSQVPSMTHSCLSVFCPPHPHPPSPSPSPSPPPPHVPHFYNAISTPTSPHHRSPPTTTITSPSPLMKVPLAPSLSTSPITHHKNHQSTHSHVNPCNPPTPFTPAFHYESSPPSSLEEQEKPVSCMSTLIQAIFASLEEQEKPVSCMSTLIQAIFGLVAWILIISFLLGCIDYGKSWAKSML